MRERFWHIEGDYDDDVEAHMRILVNTRLSRLEAGKLVPRNREELVSLASAEAYTFLINYLGVLFGLRQYDALSVSAIVKYRT